MDERNGHIMKAAEAVFCAILLLAAVAALSSCRTVRTSAQRDSIRVEVRTETKILRDTAYFEIPAQCAERTTPTDSSHLENEYAESTARINHDGTLYHDLKTKPQEIPVVNEIPVQHTDSTYYEERTEKEIVTVRESNKFTLASTIILWTLVAAAVGYGIFRIIRKFRA